MCKSKLEGGGRCYSHANTEYQNAVENKDKLEKVLHRDRLRLQNIKNSIQMLDLAQEMGEVDDETYNRELDRLVAYRQEGEKAIEAQETGLEDAGKKIDYALYELRTTPRGLRELKKEILAETDPAIKEKLSYAYNVGRRVMGSRKEMGKRFLNNRQKASEMRIEADKLNAIAASLPDYDIESKKIKEEAVLKAQMAYANAYLTEHDGREITDALFDRRGEIVPAKLTKTKYGHSWGVLSDPKNPMSKFKGFVSLPRGATAKSHEEYYASKGLTLGKVWAVSEARIAEDEYGNKKVSIHRTDGGYSPYVVIETFNSFRKKRTT